MKRMISLLLTLTLCTGAIFTAGCHGKKNQDSFVIPKEFDPSKKYEITFWAKNDTNRRQVDIYNSAVESFTGIYPNITVNLRLYTDYGAIYNDVITNISTGTTPNVCITYPDHIATYMTGNNVVVPLDELMNDPRFGLGGSEVRFDSPTLSEIVPRFLEEGVLGGSHMALPFMRSTEALYINKTLLDNMGIEIPEKITWDFVWDVSEAALEKNEDGTYKVNGQNVLIPFIYKSTDNMMITQLKQLDAGYSAEGGEILIFNDTTTSLLEEISKHGKSRAFSTFKISSYPGNFLNANQCIFAIDSTAGATWIGSAAPLHDISADQMRDFETEVRMIPQFDPDHPKMISQGPSICLFNAEDPGEVMASWLFAQYLLTNEVQIAYSQTEGYIPVTLKAQESSEYTDYLARMGEDDTTHYEVKIKAAKLLLENTENTFITPVFNGSASLRDAAGALIENTVKGVRRGGTFDEAFVNKMYKDVNSLYRLDQMKTINGAEPTELGPLPKTSVLLLSSIGAAWIVIALVFFRQYLKNKKKDK
ncbi:MAG: extracellular solute-binding protein [Lachnospiraceae bacterium]|nr:extracellular solute-binding protein [Lachnospiraceae bacterium]